MKLLSGILLFFVLESFFVLKGLEFVDYLAYFCEYIVNASHTFLVSVFVTKAGRNMFDSVLCLNVISLRSLSRSGCAENHNIFHL